MTWDDLPARFRKKVRVAGDDECWDWTGARNLKAYGRWWSPRDGRFVSAHRYVFAQIIGPVPAGMGLFVCHRCDNPPCCNPRHLFLTTHEGNMRDGVRKGRFWGPPGETNGNAKLTDPQAKMIRHLHDEMPLTHRYLANLYGIDRANLSRILRGERWKHVFSRSGGRGL